MGIDQETRNLDDMIPRRCRVPRNPESKGVVYADFACLPICLHIYLSTPGAPHAFGPRRPACQSVSWRLHPEARPREWAAARGLPRGDLPTSQMPLQPARHAVWSSHRPLLSHRRLLGHIARRRGCRRTRPARDGSPSRLRRRQARMTLARFAAAPPRLGARAYGSRPVLSRVPSNCELIARLTQPKRQNPKRRRRRA